MRPTFFRAMALALLLAGCGGDGDGDGGDGGGNNNNNNNGNGGAVEATIEIRNNSALTMDEVRYSTCAASVLGDDVLAGAVGPQQTFTFEVDEGGCYDVAVYLHDTEGNEYEARFSAVEVEDGGKATITVANP